MISLQCLRHWWQGLSSSVQVMPFTKRRSTSAICTLRLQSVFKMVSVTIQMHKHNHVTVLSDQEPTAARESQDATVTTYCVSHCESTGRHWFSQHSHTFWLLPRLVTETAKCESEVSAACSLLVCPAHAGQMSNCGVRITAYQRLPFCAQLCNRPQTVFGFNAALAWLPSLCKSRWILSMTA